MQLVSSFTKSATFSKFTDKNCVVCNRLCEQLQPNLLSAHRCLVRRIDAIEASEELSGKGDSVTLFVFSDSLEVSMCVYRQFLYSSCRDSKTKLVTIGQLFHL